MRIVAPFKRRIYPRYEPQVVERTHRSTPSALTLILAAFFGGAAFFVFWNMGQTLASLPASKMFPQIKNERFGACGYIARDNCVIDGDTFYFVGQKIRIADIDAPETSGAQCASEAELGARATLRLRELLNAGPFDLRAYQTRDADQYGRKLRLVMRDGRSLGDTLVAEGLARRWNGRRLPWCA
jgi:micrococcal nuclease